MIIASKYSQFAPPRFQHRIALIATVATVAIASAFLVATPASAAAISLAPSAITTTAGTTGSGQSFANLATQDQSGVQDSWGKYVEFSPAASKPYNGYRTFSLPSSVSPSSVTALAITVNYKGPSSSSQTWTWALYNWSTSSWTSIGTNATAPSWGAWKILQFSNSGSANALVSAAGQIRLRLSANNTSDSADIDFESVTATTATAPAGTISLPTANAQFDYQLSGPYTPLSSVGVVSRDRLAPPAPGKYNICYVNLMQTQPDETGQSSTNPPYGTTQWWKNNHFSALLPDESTADPTDVIVDANWDEVVFDLRTAAKRTALFDIQKPWLQKCANDGFKAVEPDNLDTYTRSTDKSGQQMMLFEHNAAFLKLVIPYVHSLGLAIAQKNVNTEFVDWKAATGKDGRNFVDSVTPAQGFDFAIAEGCESFNECDEYTAVYGNLVYEIEYTDDNANRTVGATTKTVFQWACYSRGASISVILRDRGVSPAGTNTYRYEYC